jgi:hypothetical protein
MIDEWRRLKVCSCRMEHVPIASQQPQKEKEDPTWCSKTVKDGKTCYPLITELVCYIMLPL